MDYSIAYDERADICTVTVTGRIKRPDDSVALQKLAPILRDKHGCSKFVFDMRDARISGSTMAIFEAGRAPADKNMPRDFKIALVYSKVTEDDKFMETVLVNRGYKLRVFESLERAVDWMGKAAASG
jgi:hypothetical protein